MIWMDIVQAKQEQLLAVEREQQEKMEKFRAKMLIERESHEMALQARSAAKEEVTIKEVHTKAKPFLIRTLTPLFLAVTENTPSSFPASTPLIFPATVIPLIHALDSIKLHYSYNCSITSKGEKKLRHAEQEYVTLLRVSTDTERALKARLEGECS